MSSTAKVFKGCRVLLAPAKDTKATAPKSTVSSKKVIVGAKPKSKVSAVSAAAAAKQPRPPTARPAGLFKLAPVSSALHSFLGASESTRSDAVKKVWEYVKLHDLQNPTDRREVYCDDKLKTIFEGKEKVGFTEIGRLISSHFVKNN